MDTKQRSRNDYTIGWICALPKEQTAASAMLDTTHADLPTPDTDENSYTLGSIGCHNVVIACLPKGWFGTNQTARVASQMLSTFPSVKTGLIVGIGGGVPPKVRLGDVVVSTEWVQWDFGKLNEDGTQYTGRRCSPPTVLLSAISKLVTKHETSGTRIPEHIKKMREGLPNLPSKYTSVQDLNDPLNDGNARDEKFDVARIHYGVVASGNKVIKDAASRDAIDQALGGNILCFEMEAAGLIGFPYIVIRGICDYADSRKNDDWQEYAAVVAAAYAKELLACVQPREVNSEQPVKDILPQLLHDFSLMKSKLDRQEDLKILKWITSKNYISQHNDFLSIRKEGTGQWLLESSEFRSWLSSDNNHQVLLCPGIPGAGKTILTAIVIDHLSQLFSKDPTIGLAYIYFNFKRNDEQQLNDLLSSLLEQLCNNQSSVPKVVEEMYNNHSKEGSRPSFHELVTAVRSVVALFSRVYIILDALDECQTNDDCRSKLLSELFKLQSSHHLNIFATSRYVAEILDKFAGCEKLEIRARDEDVRSYLDEQIALSGKKLLRKHSEEVINAIVKVVDGMFLLAKFHFQSIKDKSSLRQIRNTLENLPSGKEAYNETYQNTMERIQQYEPDLRDQAYMVLSWIICATRPLSTQELQHALAIEVDDPEINEDNLPEIEDMTSLCAGLIIVDEESDVIRLVHYTTQEYFEQTWSKWFPKAHFEIATRCLTYVSYDVFADGWCQSDEEFEQRVTENKFYTYSASHWAHHVRQVSAIQPSLIDRILPLLLRFLRNNQKVAANFEALDRKILKSTTGLSPREYGGNRESGICGGVHLAAKLGSVEALNAIIAEGDTDIDIKDWQWKSPLEHAADEEQEAAIRLLLDNGAGVKEYLPSDETLLHVAADLHQLSLARVLVERGADINARQESTLYTPLMSAVWSRTIEIVKLLVECGADLEARDESGCTPLLCAAWTSHPPILKILVENGADLEIRDKEGRQPLLQAVLNGNLCIVKLLVEKGADLEAKDYRHGRTALSIAALEDLVEIVKLLVEAGADVTVPHFARSTALSCAISHKDESLVKLLVAKGANLEEKVSLSRQTALSYAVAFQSEVIIKTLLESGAEVNIRDKSGYTPLTKAIILKDVMAVSLLLENGADFSLKTKYGLPPTVWAAISGDEMIKGLLEERGANMTFEDEDGEAVFYRSVIGMVRDARENPEAEIGIRPEESKLVRAVITEFERKKTLEHNQSPSGRRKYFNYVSESDPEGSEAETEFYSNLD